ncbi:MAG: hypothetical protein AB8H80_10135 [Planctomycetota bacterium]
MVSIGTFEVDRLFVLGTQMAVGGTLVGIQADGAGMLDIIKCPWAVIGLAQWMEASFSGRPGRMKPQPSELHDSVVAQLKKQRPKMRRLLQLPYSQFFDSTSRTEQRWDASWAFVHFLLDEKQKPDLSKRFADYLLQSIRKGGGASSSAFDKAMGMRMEAIHKAFYAWLDSL